MKSDIFEGYKTVLDELGYLFHRLTLKRLKTIDEINREVWLFYPEKSVHEVIDDLSARLKSYNCEKVQNEIFDEGENDKTRMNRILEGYTHRIKDTLDRCDRCGIFDARRRTCFYGYKDNEPAVNEINGKLTMLFAEAQINIMGWNTITRTVSEFKSGSSKKAMFEDYLINCDREVVMRKLRELISRQKGRHVALVIEACIKKGYLLGYDCSIRTIIESFNLECSNESINKFLKKDRFSDEELETMIKAIP